MKSIPRFTLKSLMFVTVLCCCSCQRGNKGAALDQFGAFTIEIIDSISLEPENYYPSGVKVLPERDGGGWWSDNRESLLVSNNLTGAVNSISVLPRINELNGINRISDFYVYNEDSIFVLDAQFLGLLLIGKRGQVTNFWRLSKFWPNGNAEIRGKLISVSYNENRDLIIELSGSENYHQPSSEFFYEFTNLVHQLNLSASKIQRQGIKYPQISPFSNGLFWTGEFPNIIKSGGLYVVTFPIDPNVYLYDDNMNYLTYVDGSSENFPSTSGGAKYSSQQERNYALITRKLNGYSLSLKSAFTVNGRTFFIRVFRKPLGDKREIPDDMMTFTAENFKQSFYMQLFEIEYGQNSVRKVGEDLLINSSMGNFVGVDSKKNLYFLGNSDTNESPFLLKAKIKIE